MKKTLLKTSIVLVLIIGLVLIISYIVYPVEYVNRVLRWGDSDVNDYQKFPERIVESSGLPPFQFETNLDEDLVRSIFEQSALVDELETFLESTGTQAFLVIQSDQILYEGYFSGSSRESIVTSFSIAKSFTSTLVGIAISEGYINSVNDPITDYLPELLGRDLDFAGITIRDLLMMSSGIEYIEFPFVNGDDAKTYYYPDLRWLALEDTEIIASPGETFHYNNFHPLLLGMILERATGRSVARYLQETLWQPLGMEFPASWSLDENGFEKMESGINARATDFAKFGRLFLHGGEWNGEQVLPAAWVAEATQPDPSLDYASYYGDDFIFSDGRGYYKYLWWGLTRDGAQPDFMALGNHGQFIYVSPAKELIIVRFGESYGGVDALGWVNLFFDFASVYPEPGQ